MSRKSNAMKNMFWGLIVKFVYILVPFIMRTLIINYLGLNYLGLNNLFASVLQIFSIAELGLGTAVGYNLYKPIAQKDTRSICALMRFYRNIYRVIGIGIIVMGIILIPFLPNLIKDGYPHDINIYILYLMYLSNTGLGYLLFSYKRVLLTAHQNNSTISKINLVVNLFMYILQATILIYFKNYYLYYLVSVIATIVINISLCIIVNKLYPEYKPYGDLSKEQKSSISEKVKGLMLYKFTGQTKNAFDSVVMSSFIGLISVAKYGNYFYIMNNLSQLLATFAVSIEASIGDSLVVESKQKNYNNFRLLTFIYGVVTGICCTCLFNLYQPFIKLWLGSQGMFPFNTVILLCLYFFLLTSCEIRNTFINASGLWWQNRYRAIGSAICNIILNVVLVNIWGVNGIIFATLVSTLIFDCFFTSRTLFRYCFEEYDIKEYLVWWIKHGAITLFAVIITYIICSMINLSGLFEIIAKGIICVVVSTIIYLISYRKDPNKDAITKMLSSIKGKIRKR